MMMDHKIESQVRRKVAVKSSRVNVLKVPVESGKCWDSGIRSSEQ